MGQNKYSISAQAPKYMHHKLSTVICLLGEHNFNHALDFSANHQLCWPAFDASVHFNNNGSGSVPQVMVHIRKVVQCAVFPRPCAPHIHKITPANSSRQKTHRTA